MAFMVDAEKKITELKRKLESAISSRSALEEGSNHQTALLTQFISKLSLIAKGADVVLDNKLATLRSMLLKSASIVDIEALISDISALLKKHSAKNEQNIRKMHDDFQSAGVALQKVNGIPNDLRRQLRTLLQESSDTKDSLSQYVPALSQLISFYQAALKSKSDIPAGGLLGSQIQPSQPVEDVHFSKNHDEVIKRFTKFLKKLTVSAKYRKKVSKIQAELNQEMPDEELFDSFLAVFDVISDDLKQERNTAKIFLSTLSDTLSTVQSAVTSTISSNDACKKKHQELNEQLQQQIGDMAVDLDQANNLADIKGDISEKLQRIASTLESKTDFEYQQQQLLENQLIEMKSKVDKLEEQSKSFEKRIQAQQAKSMQDALTKLANRAAFDDFFAKEIVRYHHKKFDLSIAVIDLDDFKRINDTYGHTAGDKTLQVIANTLKKSVENEAFCGRYGGEEFVLVFSTLNKAQVMKKLNAIRLKVARLPFKFKNTKVSLTLSIGVSHIISEDNVHSAFERADAALYQAKEKGKNTIIYS